MNDLKSIASELEKTMQCNCDLDNWKPERDSGHSWVCRIDKEARAKLYERNKAALEKTGG